ncbi:uncharacterized protein LOC100845910 isoform X2 [Brachypodium distachyon]|nr:uncharacterized protein LOC100845910 isoform X2 [Brachypodium distachyon]KQJ95727.1 hypothetical protein BRADI_3g18740v3 [Brachypodium distachyon]KQJ95728.1 hypothetical protein BRADI_3g18740v3 [Brachypodium distachyon]PNT66941.1 hypothetical protein BRADI_3g18740v3 [Brachypodium distachyon]|eukprot:XP_003571571.1 uncharacterized protein LOC100845910 isoform X2 [Brachypodium distachyon]
MDETMGRRTVGGLLVTKGGSILVFRDESPRHKDNTCCTRLGCSSKLFPDKCRKMHRAGNEEATPRRPHVFGNSNRVLPEGRMEYASTRRNAASTCSETGNTPRRETGGRDLLARLKEKVNVSRKRSVSGGTRPQSAMASSTGSTSNSRLAPRTRKNGRNRDAVNMCRVTSGNSVEDVEKSDDEQPAGSFLSRRLFRHGSRLQGGRLSYLEGNLADSNEYWRFGMDESDEMEDYVFSDQHRGMRMDIEDMSYEELLALGDRIGTVSTGLSDDVLSDSLKRILYVRTTSASHEDGDIKCIICQEEYSSGEEVAKIVCNHYYHVTCIQHWLRQKNWCPICKMIASATNLLCN